ncbi:MAG: hypothetical protein KC776_20180 [Myxococcales bacterium]|nr:hypothetical protein [Myxococcales bacterium]MCB9579679.1 hypothetical protein [Polyangiaceae bacterium]
MRIDFEVFAALTAAIAGCAPQPEPKPAPRYFDSTESSGAVATALPAPTDTTPPEPVGAVPDAPVEVVETPVASGCNNDVGDVNCNWVNERTFSGPACEGFGGTCDLLAKGYGYRLRVGAAVARCFEERGRAACDIRVRKQCFRSALAEACPDAAFTQTCESAVARCKAKHQRPDFTVSECIQALSSLEGGNLKWAQDSIGPSAEGCKLMYPVY